MELRLYYILSTFNRIAFIQNTCLYSYALEERKEGAIQYDQSATRCTKQGQSAKESRIEHALNRDRYTHD
jgi:hypothetical protein